MTRLMDLKIDYAFKKVFGKPGNEPILIAFLNAALDPPGNERITWIEILNNEQNRQHLGDKMSVLDILARTERGMYVNIEIQLANEYDIERRTLYYWSRVYAGQLRQGMSYRELKRTITMNILNFRYIWQTDRYHTRFRVKEDTDGFALTDVLEVHFMELPKLMDKWEARQASPEENLLARWLLLLEADDHEDIRGRLEAIAMEDSVMKKAFEQWEEVSQDTESWIAYEQRRKALFDELAKVREAELREQEAKLREQEAELREQEAKLREQEAEQRVQEMEQRVQEAELRAQAAHDRGVTEGIHEVKRATAQAMMAKGLDFEFISEITGLSIAELEAIKQEIN